MDTKSNKIFLLACLLGTALEWFDFSMFGVLSPIMADLYFPSQDQKSAIIKILFVFSAGFIIRPIAAIYWGTLGDRFGRKSTILFTIALMALASFLMSVLPNYAVIGAAAPILLLLLRITQGFAASGEHAGMLTYLFEMGGEQHRATWPSISMSGVFLGMGVATVLVLIVKAILGDEAFIAWGWRTLFFVSSLIGITGYFFRKKFQDSYRSRESLGKSSFSTILKKSLKNKKKLLISIGVFQLAVMVPYIVYVFSVANFIHQKTILSNIIYLISNLTAKLDNIEFFL